MIYASSLAEAQKNFNYSFEEPILVGGKKFVTLSFDDLVNVIPNEFLQPGTEYIATSCRSLLFCNHTIKGTLYRIGEVVAFASDNGEGVLKIEKIFSLVINTTCYTIACGILYSTIPNVTHIYSTNSIVVPTLSVVSINATKIICKVIRYPHQNNAKDVIVPLYPQMGDMVRVHGDGNNIWLAHIQTIDPVNKVCKAFFYVPVNTSANPVKYCRESRGHRSREVISWNSFIGFANGIWENNFWIPS